MIAEKRWVRMLRKIAFAGLMTMMLMILGLFEGIGFHLYHIQELRFTPNRQLGYAIVTFKCDIVYNPIIYPSYWMTNSGHLDGTFERIIVPEGWTSGEHPSPVWGLKPQDRLDTYLIYMLTWGLPLNLFVIFCAMVAIEIVAQRGLYLVLFSGMVGFFALEIVGIILGFVAGSVLALVLLKLWPNNPIVVFWRSLWTDSVQKPERVS